MRGWGRDGKGVGGGGRKWGRDLEKNSLLILVYKDNEYEET